MKDHHLILKCFGCEHPIPFSLFSIKEEKDTMTCHECGKDYRFNDPTLFRQLQKFEKLCKQIIESEEILSKTTVGVQVGELSVEIPYKLLLSRFHSILHLEIEGKTRQIEFRIEPLEKTTAIKEKVNAPA